MKIESIELINFRQFEKEKLVFTDVPGKKVTIIHGQTHIGKTTLVKAFLWCLYRSDDSFKTDPILVNKDAEKYVSPGDKKTVKVIVSLEHNKFQYVIQTEQTFVYLRNGNEGSFSPVNKEPTRHIVKMSPEGSPVPVPSEQVDFEMNDILPDNLKSYFFYDGENNKIDDVAEKSNLQDAVRNIMNLNVREELIKYYSDGYSGRLVERFSDKKTTSNFEEVDAWKEEKKQKESKLELTEGNNVTIQNDANLLDAQIKELEDKIAANADAAKLQKEAKEVSQRIAEAKELRDNLFASLLRRCDSDDSLGLAGLFSTLAYKKANLSVEYANIKTNERAYKHLTCDSVDEIIKKGVCVCGQKIESGSDFYKHLEEEKQYLSPRDYSASLKSFTDRFNDEKESADNSVVLLSQDAAKLKQTINNISQLSSSLAGLDDKLKDFHGDVESWKKDLDDKKRARDHDLWTIKYSEENTIPTLKKEIADLQEKIDKHTDASEKNNHIQLYLNYIAAVKDMAQDRLEKKKDGIAVTLEQQVNDLFHAIVGTNATTLKLNRSNYNVEPYQNDLRISLSTGQKTMKNLAFVGGLIYLAKNKDKIGGSEGAELDEPDDYPLVMDAPFSNLSKDDIKRACTELPKYCSQLIITLLDKDFDLAIDVLKPFVDKSYTLKTNDTSTDSHFEEDDL